MKQFFRPVFILFVFMQWVPAVSLAEANKFGGPIDALTAQEKSSVWALSGGKLFAIDAAAETTTPVDLTELPEGALASAIATGADGRLYVGGEGIGIWAYDVEEDDWQSLNETLPNLNVTALAAHSTQSDTLYAFISDKGIFRSENGGVEWVQVDGGPQEEIRTFLHSNMPGSMESGWLFAGTERGVARSMDCFCLWSDAGELRGGVSSLTFNPQLPMNVYAVINEQVYHSQDGGESWGLIESVQDVTAVAFSSQLGLVVGTRLGKLIYRNDSGAWQRLND